jgi:hypothetical protein
MKAPGLLVLMACALAICSPNRMFGAVSCTRTDNTDVTATAYCVAAYFKMPPPMPAGLQIVYGPNDTMNDPTYAYAGSAATSGPASAVIQDTVTCSAAPGSTSVAPEVDTVCQIDVGAGTWNTGDYATGHYYASGGTSWQPTQNVSTLSGTFWLYASGSTTMSGGGSVSMQNGYEPFFLTCNGSHLTGTQDTTTDGTVSGMGVVGGQNVNFVSPGGINQYWYWNDTTIQNPIPLGAQLGGPGTWEASGSTSGGAEYKWDLKATAWFQVN